ncbi:MAG: hypothetical protein B7Z81_09365 [Acidocella sp. 20-61-6]|nr:MAG: hypothetical protein B7Z81_09365 [Acidocella sp. 20-61-6]
MLTNLPFALPAWMPDWLFLLLALPVLLYALAFLLMPFSVFGVKARLEALESEIDSLHEDLRMMTMRSSGASSPASPRLDAYDELPSFGRPKPRTQPVYDDPPPPRPTAPRPVAPPMSAPTRERLAPAPPPPRPFRREPRLD